METLRNDNPNKESHMSKGIEEHKNVRKKAKLTLKEKRLKKKEKKYARSAHEHDVHDVITDDQ